MNFRPEDYRLTEQDVIAILRAHGQNINRQVAQYARELARWDGNLTELTS